MERYFFDIQSGREFFADEEGLRLPNQKAAEVEAMHTLTGMAKDFVFKGAARFGNRSTLGERTLVLRFYNLSKCEH
jgi:hypothetical protein